MSYLYDLEVFPNLFTATFISLDNKREVIDRYIQADIDGKTSKKKDVLRELDHRIFVVKTDAGINEIYGFIEFVGKVDALIGYNNHYYDDIIVDYLVRTVPNLEEKVNLNDHIFGMSKRIIAYEGFSLRRDIHVLKGYKHKYLSIDLMKLHYLDKRKVSLKQVAIQLKYYRIQDLPYRFDKIIEDSELEAVIDYNINDVLITYVLYYEKIDELRQRAGIQKLYGVPCISDSRSKVGDRLMTKFYSESTGLHYNDYRTRQTLRSAVKFSNIVSNRIHFSTPQLRDFLNKVKGTTVRIGDNSKWEEKLLFNNKVYVFAKGGLHSDDRPGVFKETDDCFIIDADVGSFYPNIMLNERVAPAHVAKEAFLAILDKITKERLEAKANGETTKADALKITINSIYGKLGFAYGWLFDVKAMYQTTINGQLYLLMLIERIEEAGFEVISANTDGVVSIVPKDRKKEYISICKEWARETNFTLDYTTYNKYVRTTVNDYLTVKSDGNIKRKGDFVIDPEIDKGYFAPVIPLAVNEYYINGTPIEDTLKNHKDIYDFCISQKTGSDFVNEFHIIVAGDHYIEKQQKSIRYYVSNSGGSLMKRYVEDHPKFPNKRISLVAKYNVTVFNNFIARDRFEDYNLNYNFYRMKCYEIINKVSGNLYNDIRKKGGTLFD